MSKEDALKKELEKMGIFTDADLRAEIKKTSLNISIMAAGRTEERAVS